MMEGWNDGMMECWNIGIKENRKLERRNINRGFKQLRVWQDAIELYLLAMKMFVKFPFEMKRTASNAIDAAHSIGRNIAEGYCRRSLKEYLNHLNIALGSCGEFHSCYYSFYKANMISKEDFESLDALHYKVENERLRLIKSLQRKLRNGEWADSFQEE
jgi:four helix bundle protein